MHTKSLFAMTLLLVGSQNLTACTIVEASDDADATAVEQDAATTDETTDETDATTDQTNETTDGDGGTGASDATDETDETSANEDAAASDSSDDTSSEEDDEDAGASDSDDSDGDGGDETTEPEEDEDAGSGGGTVYKNGTVSLTQTVTTVASAEIVGGAASASFAITTFGSTEPDPGGGMPCETTTVGNCTLSECEFGVDPEPEDPEYSYEQVSAGEIKISGTTEDITLTPLENGNYSPASGSTRWWSGGEELVAAAPGGDEVPEFSLELTAPSAVTLTAPELSLLTPVSASRSADFEVLWDNGEEGTVTVNITDTDTDPVTRMISCSVPADEGGVEVDASLLADFGSEALVSASIGTTTTQTVEDWTLAFTATSSVGSGTVEFEE